MDLDGGGDSRGRDCGATEHEPQRQQVPAVGSARPRLDSGARSWLRRGRGLATRLAWQLRWVRLLGRNVDDAGFWSSDRCAHYPPLIDQRRCDASHPIGMSCGRSCKSERARRVGTGDARSEIATQRVIHRCRQSPCGLARRRSSRSRQPLPSSAGPQSRAGRSDPPHRPQPHLPGRFEKTPSPMAIARLAGSGSASPSAATRWTASASRAASASGPGELL